MNVAIDLGNTKTKIGVFEQHKLLFAKDGQTEGELVAYINNVKPDNVIIASVAGDAHKIKEQFDKQIVCMVLDAQTPLPIQRNYHTPATLGVDRIAAATGAWALHKNKNALIIDIGSCITYDLMLKGGSYQGGAISPGMRMKLKALHTFTARLPLVEPIEQINLIGKSTEESILSGVINGTAAEIDEMIKKFLNNITDLQIIICGGDATFFESRIKAPIFVIPELVLIGLNRILQHNVSNTQ